jgi:hypothetical protein
MEATKPVASLTKILLAAKKVMSHEQKNARKALTATHSQNVLLLAPLLPMTRAAITSSSSHCMQRKSSPQYCRKSRNSYVQL